MLVALILLTIVSFLVFLARPLWGIYTLLALIPLEYIFVFGDLSSGSGYTLLKFVSLSVLGAWATHLLLNASMLRENLVHPILKPLVALVLLALTSIFWLSEPNLVTKPIYKYISGAVLILVIVSFVQSRQALENCIKALLFGGLICGIATLHQYFVLLPAGEIKGMRAGDFTGGSGVNHTAELLTIITPACFFFLRSKKQVIWKILAIAASALMIEAVTTTFSRAAFFGLILVILIDFLRLFQGRQILYGLVFGLTFVGALYFAFFNLEEEVLQDRVGRTSALLQVNRGDSYETSANTSEERIEHWHGALLIFLDHPVLGVGAGGFGKAYGEHYQFETGSQEIRGDRRSAHSTAFTLLSEQGLVGFFVLSWFFWVWYKSTEKGPVLGEEKPYYIGLQYLFRSWWLLCVYLSITNQLHYHKIFWVIAGLSFAWQTVSMRGRRDFNNHQKKLRLAVVSNEACPAS
jgi:O-antigen ligase